MSNEERLLLKREKEQLRSYFGMLKREFKSFPKDKRDTKEFYYLLQDLTVVSYRLDSIKRALFDARFRRFYLSTLLENFIFGEEEKVRGGR